MLWESVDGLVIQAIRPTQEVLPFLIAKTISGIGFRIITGAQPGSRPAAKSKAESFHGIEAVESTCRPDLEGSGLLIPCEQQRSPIHQTPERFHMLQAIGIRIDLVLECRQGI